MAQCELNAIVTEIGTAIDAAVEIVPHGDERARQRIRGGNSQSDLHGRPPILWRDPTTIRSNKIPCFTVVRFICSPSIPQAERNSLSMRIDPRRTRL
jgi:hypothetical protein